MILGRSEITKGGPLHSQLIHQPETITLPLSASRVTVPRLMILLAGPDLQAIGSIFTGSTISIDAKEQSRIIPTAAFFISPHHTPCYDTLTSCYTAATLNACGRRGACSLHKGAAKYQSVSLLATATRRRSALHCGATSS